MLTRPLESFAALQGGVSISSHVHLAVFYFPVGQYPGACAGLVGCGRGALTPRACAAKLEISGVGAPHKIRQMDLIQMPRFFTPVADDSLAHRGALRVSFAIGFCDILRLNKFQDSIRAYLCERCVNSDFKPKPAVCRLPGTNP